MNKCQCGCGLPVKNKWHPGHNRRGVPPTNKKGGTFSGGYKYIYSPDHPHADAQGYVEEHRLIIERHIGRTLSKEEIVHHINSLRSDNRLENLQLMTKREHDRIHTQVAPKCLDCGAKHKARGLCSSCYEKYRRRGLNFPLPASRGNRWTKEREAEYGNRT